MINLQDRKDFLLGTGVSPGEDNNYDTQASNLSTQQGVLRDNAKQNILQRIEVLLQSGRHAGPTPYNGAPSPLEFAQQVLSKSIPTPSELNPINIIKSIPSLVEGVANTVMHPIAAAKQFALNPPEPSTYAALALPGAVLSAYRNLVPIEARTYLHHMAGIPTPFTSVTEGERAALTDIAQEKIDRVLDKRLRYEQDISNVHRQINDYKMMTPSQLIRITTDNELAQAGSLEQARLNKIDKVKKRLAIMVQDKPKFGELADNENVRNDFQDITGKQLKGFQIYPFKANLPYNFQSAFGKTYVEPMVEPGTGKIIPKSIQDTYKFYPDAYSYIPGQGRGGILDRLTNLNGGHSSIPSRISSLFNMGANDPLGIIARKLGMARPTSIINIPLRGPAPMNAYDKAAILLGGKPLTEQRK